MNAHELFRSGKLDQAIEAMNAEVRSNPADPDRRSFLADMLCIVGNFDRADVQLDAIAKTLPGAVTTVALIRQLVRAEQWRQQCFKEGRVPEFLAQPDEHIQLRLRALVELQGGDVARASATAEEAEAIRPALRGSCDGKRFDDLRDCDDITAGVFEVLTSTGKYYWVPADRVIRLELRPIERARDLVWRRAGMEVRGGPDGEVYIPAIYAPAPAEAAARLGRTTEWTETTPVRGIGLRTFLVGEETLTLPQVQVIEFDDASPAGGR
ncbi:MAG: type VI secretion system accessory protein TagJ [Planctomycetota bacterium]